MTLAKQELAKIYGERQINLERPFTAKLTEGTWYITGTLHCKDQHNVITEACVGGIAMANIRKSDGRVLKTGHTR